MEQASASDQGRRNAPDPVTGDPLTILSRVPRDAQLLLRDYIAGLEAQAGSARAAADRLERKFKVDTDQLLLLLAGARSERDAAIAERDSALRAVTALTGRRIGRRRPVRPSQ